MLSAIVCMDNFGGIGKNGDLLYKIPDDLKRFKEITSGNTIIMGRKTFESLPGVLPNRKHVILTRDKNFSVDNENVEVIHSVDEIINNYKDSSVEAFIIGGGEIYKEFLKEYYPIMKESAEFFEDYLVENKEGYLVTCK